MTITILNCFGFKKMNQGKVELIKYTNDKDAKVFEYSVVHHNGSTYVEQLLTIRGPGGQAHPAWVAELALDDFPEQATPEDAALKMADWLERLAASIRKGEYQSLTDATFKDLDD